MAWLTRITADEQVEYRLREQAGCAVVEAAPDQAAAVEDAAVDYRLRPDGDGRLVWVGGGLAEFGLAAGARLGEESKDAARRIMNGCHPATGARLVHASTSARAHPDAQLTSARLVEAIEAAATERGLAPEELLEGKPKQQKKLGQLQRMVHRRGEAHRSLVGPLHKLARAAGLDLADVYGAEELERARANADKRIDDRVRGWDLVLDLPKSDSVLAGLMGEAEEREYRELVHQAKVDTVRQLEEWVGYAVGSKDGKPVRLATRGLVGWSVEHLAARPVRAGEPGDPHLHLHVTIANMARCEDGQWRSIANSGQDLHRHARAADAVFKARVRALAYERFGVRREEHERTGAWEIPALPEELRDAFSRRAALVDATAGEDASREDKARVSAAQRRQKLEVDAEGMRGSWRTRAEGLVGDVGVMVAAAAPGPPDGGGSAGARGPGGPRIPPPDPASLAAIVFDPETGLTSTQKDFSRAQLLAAVGNALQDGIGAEPGRLDALADQVLAVEGYAVPLPHLGSTVMTSTARYTTHDILSAENVAVRQALERFNEGAVQLDAEQAAAATSVFEVANGFPLSGEQRQVIDRMLTAGHGIDATVGVAGAGKSTLMEACRIGWDTTGTTYAGATLAAVAAQQLTDASGIPARTVASWLRRIETGQGLDGVDVLVIDEATMVDDRSAATLMTEAARTGTKVLAIGDPKQLQAVGPGGWFAEVHRLVGGPALTENRRQQAEAERAALEVWRTGDHEQALQLLADGGRVHAAETADEARSQILTTWNALRERWADPYERLDALVVLAARNSDVNLINAGAQQIRRAAGELGQEHTYAQPGGEQLTLAVGDAVRVRVNDYRSKRGEGPNLLNGHRGVVTAMDAEHRVEVTWRTKDRTAEGGWRYASAWLDHEQLASGALSLGYAMTVAASQGMTAQASLLYGHGSNAFATYPGLTRGREQNHIWLPLQVVEDEDTQARLGAARSEKERLQRAVTAFARYLKQERGDRMISDLLREAPAPASVPPQAVESPVRDTTEETRRRIRAARAKSPSLSVEFTPEHHARLERLRSHLAERQHSEAAIIADIPSWQERPYGSRADAALQRGIAHSTEQAEKCEQAALEAEQQARMLAAELKRDEATSAGSRGRRTAEEAGAVLDEADGHVRTARTELVRAAEAHTAAQEATAVLRRLEANKNKGRLTLRMAGTSRKENRKLTDHYTAQRAGHWQEQNRAANVARDARIAAWETVRGSAHSERFREMGATRPAPRDLDIVERRLTAMREHLPEIAQRIDRADLQRLAQHSGAATKNRESAVSFRTAAEGMRTEQALRSQLSDVDPQRHRAEQKDRSALVAQQQREARGRARRSIEADARSRGYQPPPPSRSGPSLGM